MKKSTLFLLAIVVALCTAIPASAQFKFGLKAGMNVNSLKFDKEVFNSDNKAGFTGGAMVEFTVPVIGIGMDASVMYVRRTASYTEGDYSISKNRDYIDIPVNLKYKLNVPAINKIIRPYVTTGPAFAFLVSKKDFNEFIKNKSCDISWNFGFGVELVQHVQIGASYGIGLTKALETTGVIDDGRTIDGKNKYWTVTAAYLF